MRAKNQSEIYKKRYHDQKRNNPFFFFSFVEVIVEFNEGAIEESEDDTFELLRIADGGATGVTGLGRGASCVKYFSS
jgi:hypothetical protein